MKGDEPGVTLDSIKYMEMISSLVKDKNFGEKCAKKVAKALSKLFEGASSISIDDASEN